MATVNSVPIRTIGMKGYASLLPYIHKNGLMNGAMTFKTTKKRIMRNGERSAATATQAITSPMASLK